MANEAQELGPAPLNDDAGIGADGQPLVMDAAQAGKKKKLSIPRGFRWAGAVCIIMFIGIGISRCMLSRDSLERMRTSGAAPSEKELRIINPKTTEEYKEKLDAYSEQKSRETLKKGGTFVQPVGEVKPAVEVEPVAAPQVRIEPVQKPAPKKTPPPPPPPQAQPQRPKAPAAPPPLTRKERMEVRHSLGDPALISYLQGIGYADRPQAQTIVFNQPAPRTENQMVAKAGMHGASAPSGQLTGAMAGGLPFFKAGDILYCLNRVALNSDTPGPVMVEVVTGKLKGAKVIGSFQRINEHLVLQFSQVVTKDGMTYRIRGYGIDPETDATAVRSSVNNHYFARWGGLLASSFLEGFGDAVGSSGSYSSVTAYGASQRIKNYNLEDQLWMGAGKVGNRAANIFERNFNMPPTVYLKSGTEIGVLLLETNAGRKTSAPEKAQGQNGQDAGVEDEVSAEIKAVRAQSRQAENAPPPPPQPNGYGYGYGYGGRLR